MKMKALTYNYANINRISKYDSLFSKDLDRWISKDGVLFVGMMWFESSCDIFQRNRAKHANKTLKSLMELLNTEPYKK